MPTEQYNSSSALIVTDDHPLVEVGQIANHYAALNAFAAYLKDKAKNTKLTHGAALHRFADYLSHVGQGERMRAFANAVYANQLDQIDPDAWRGVTWGLVEGFKNWLLSEGEAIATVNARLSTVKTYSKIAAKAGAITPQERSMIRDVTGYTHKGGVHIDADRPVTRCTRANGKARKKAEHVTITPDQARRLKKQPDTPQGRRDAVLMALLIDHGLRCGEVAILQVADVDLKTSELHFYRPKVDKVQTIDLHLFPGTLRALRAWFDSGDVPPAGPLLRGSRKDGSLNGPGMNTSAITVRVKVLGERIGIEGLSAHDCRHHWATRAAKKYDVIRLQEAGGWSSLAMPRRYIEEARIANEGMAEDE